MVFFTCNHCGESLKKPAVEKHYQWKSCRGAVPFLTCVDCLKDFRADEFKAHTKCISEEEKYSAKGFVAKPNKNKGAQKQESWTEILQNLINKPGIDSQTKQIIEKIAGQTNVPRKKPKFINFIKNSLRISFDNANKVWTIVEEALEEFKQTTEANNRQKKKLEKKAKENGDSESIKTVQGEETNPETGKKMKKNKKKQKLNEEIDDGTNGHSNENTKARKRTKDDMTNGTEEEGTAKKKKNKSNETNGFEVHDIAANGNSGNELEQNSSAVVSDNKFDWQSTIISILSKKNSTNGN